MPGILNLTSPMIVAGACQAGRDAVFCFLGRIGAACV